MEEERTNTVRKRSEGTDVVQRIGVQLHRVGQRTGLQEPAGVAWILLVSSRSAGASGPFSSFLLQESRDGDDAR
jgi:hypothetical protein